MRYNFLLVFQPRQDPLLELFDHELPLDGGVGSAYISPMHPVAFPQNKKESVIQAGCVGLFRVNDPNIAFFRVFGRHWRSNPGDGTRL